MRKIFSILVVLGLVLGMASVATPAAAEVTKTVPTGCSTLTFDPNNCAGMVGVAYTFNFTSPKQMFGGQDAFMVEFPVGTTIGAFTAGGDVRVDGVPYGSLAELNAHVTRPAANIIRIVPLAGQDFAIGDPVVIRIGKITNPAVGSYTINLWHDRDCCVAEAFCAITYKISPRFSTYKFEIDFSPTYPGLAEGFIPPFQACGQDPASPGPLSVNTTAGWANNATLTLSVDDPGCFAPCDEATMWFVLEKAPVTSTTYLSFNGTVFELTNTGVAATTDLGELQMLPNIALNATTTLTWPLLLHFDKVGDYEICFYVECTTTVDCGDDAKSIIVEECFPFKVYQWKESFPIPLFPKWNLISLPVVPFAGATATATVLSAFPDYEDEILAVYHWDQCAMAWSAWGNTGFDMLSNIVDGKGYWVKVKYDPPVAGRPGQAVASVGTLWVFGTDRPGDPPMPVMYEVCEGWNQIGFTSLASVLNGAYLSNWLSYFGTWGYGTIYGWNAAEQQYATQIPDNTSLPPANHLVPGAGYWVNFHYDGTIYF